MVGSARQSLLRDMNACYQHEGTYVTHSIFSAIIEFVDHLKAKAPERLPKPKPLPRPDGAEDPRWRHQTEAVTKFLEARAAKAKKPKK